MSFGYAKNASQKEKVTKYDPLKNKHPLAAELDEALNKGIVLSTSEVVSSGFHRIYVLHTGILKKRDKLIPNPNLTYMSSLGEYRNYLDQAKKFQRVERDPTRTLFEGAVMPYLLEISGLIIPKVACGPPKLGLNKSAYEIAKSITTDDSLGSIPDLIKATIARYEKVLGKDSKELLAGVPSEVAKTMRWATNIHPKEVKKFDEVIAKNKKRKAWLASLSPDDRDTVLIKNPTENFREHLAPEDIFLPGDRTGWEDVMASITEARNLLDSFLPKEDKTTEHREVPVPYENKIPLETMQPKMARARNLQGIFNMMFGLGAEQEQEQESEAPVTGPPK